MSITTQGFRKMSNAQLLAQFAYTSKSGEHYPESYLNMVNKEIRRREKKRGKVKV